MPEAAVVERSQRIEAARAARREEILASARRVFATRGFRGTTIADIAEDAGIALGTVYLYFASKEDVFAALNQQLHAIIAGALSRPPGESSSLEQAVRDRITDVFEACAANRDLVRLVVLNADRESDVSRRLRAANEQSAKPLDRALRRAVDAGVIRAGDPRIMTKLIIGLVSIAVYQAFVLEEGAGAAAYRDMCIDMVSAYLRPETETAATVPV